MENEGHPDSTIIRDSGSREINTIVFVGNGAIEGGWTPIRTILDSWITSDQATHTAVKNLRKRDQEVFNLLALMSYKFKIARGLHFSGWAKHKKGNIKHNSIEHTHKEGLKPVIKTFLGLRENIANAYGASTLSLRTDEQIKTLLGENAHFVTTNWDNTLWKTGGYNENLIHLHGRCDFPDSLVFPTELLVEDAAYDFSSLATEKELAGFNHEFIKKVISTFRSNFIEALFSAHSKSANWLSKAKKIIIWGYSLGDYDADINALIATYTSNDVDKLELVVVNTDPLAFDRAIALTGITNAYHYNPVTKSLVKFSADQ